MREKSQMEVAPTPLSRFARDIGRDRVTVWRWTKLGWLNPVNIAGRPYLTAEEIARFNDRALAGEFARKPVVPTPPRARVECTVAGRGGAA